MTKDNFLPLFPNGISDVKFPIHSRKKCHLISIDLAYLQARDLAPGTSRVITILKVLGCKDESSKEHATSTLKCPDGCNVVRLLHGKVMLGHMSPDEHQVVQSDLQSRIACARATQSLLDKSTQGQYATSRRSLTAARRNGCRPDDLNHLSCRILKVELISGR